MRIENLIGYFNKKYSYSYEYEQTGGAKSKIRKTKLILYKMNTNQSDSTASAELSTSIKTTDSDNMYSSKLMPVLLIPLSNSNTITVGIFIKAGSRDETESFGIAHFLEHMTFKGTSTISSTQLMIDLDSIGAQYNAMTGHEFTLYYISGNPADIKQLLTILIDLYIDPVYPEDDIEKERNVVLEEMRMNEDSNQRQLMNKIYNSIYSDLDSKLETLSRPIIGYVDTIKKLSRKNILSYRSKNYNGSNCLLCISGNFDKREIIPVIENKFNAKLDRIKFDRNNFESNIKHDNKIQSISMLKPDIKKYMHIEKDINQTIINFVFNIYDKYNINNIALDLICDIFSNGFSSRLFNLLRNKMGVSYYNSSSSRNFNDIGNLIISVGVDHVSVLDTITNIIKELKEIKLNGINEAELAKAKKQNETSLLFQFKDPFEYLMYFGMNYLVKKPLYNLSNIMNKVENVKLTDINMICQKIFTLDNIIIGTIGKQSTSLDTKINQIIKSL